MGLPGGCQEPTKASCYIELTPRACTTVPCYPAGLTAERIYQSDDKHAVRLAGLPYDVDLVLTPVAARAMAEERQRAARPGGQDLLE